MGSPPGVIVPRSGSQTASWSRPASTTTTGSPVRIRWGRWRRTPQPSPRRTATISSSTPSMPTAIRTSTRSWSARSTAVLMSRCVAPMGGRRSSETAFSRPPTAICRCTGPMEDSARSPRRCHGGPSPWSPRPRRPWSSRPNRTQVSCGQRPRRSRPASTATRPGPPGWSRIFSTPAHCCGPWSPKPRPRPPRFVAPGRPRVGASLDRWLRPQSALDWRTSTIASGPHTVRIGSGPTGFVITPGDGVEHQPTRSLSG